MNEFGILLWVFNLHVWVAYSDVCLRPIYISTVVVKGLSDSRASGLYCIHTVLSMIYIICVTAEWHLHVSSNCNIKRTPALAAAI